ncbi:NAD(P)/FAD-dependent oxidoreductase [Candidatus Marinarcus aquaticus]|uniref:Sulfide:quinone reductase n=1 Tax=Candidatus Marinarcus aquaticus TaxID=2044504 RepID=A0A4Q0XUH6_9BACT|nr:FAD/NAD(P)-binding oxidoreductase [Candidatus Marinarcus aquaticus]RXJ60813.1 sulfide:quinone reductase [Candidatus Marinarcus aquaticus]
MSEKLKKSFELFEDALQKEGLSRRDAIKMLAMSGLLATTSSSANTQLNASGIKVKIVIVGGGLAGVSTAARLKAASDALDITIIEPNANSVSYQAGNTFIGTGLYEKKDVMYRTQDFIPRDVEFIQDKVMEFFPDNNQVITKNKQVISYDFLVVSAGVKLDFSQIKGLEALGDMYTLEENEKLIQHLEGSGASTVYNINTAVQTWKNMQASIEQAKQGKQINAVFTHPHTAIKCGGAPKKIMYLMNSRLNEAGVRKNADLTFYANSGKMFVVKEYEDAIIKQYKARNMKWNLKHNLQEIDLQNKVAIFDKFWDEKGAYDEDLEEYEMVTKHEKVEVPYDFLHFTPPMIAAPEIGNSPIGSSNGWVPVNQKTLQHVKYSNIFALGDIAAVALGKTGGSVRKQYKVVAENLLAAIANKELTAEYDGYTVCPIITDIGKVMLAEFDWSMKPTPSFPLDPTQERYIWWIMKAYLLKPMTQYGMLRGKI